MAARYSAPSVNAIVEDIEDDSHILMRPEDDGRKHARDKMMGNTKDRRKHRSTPSGSKHQSKPKTKNPKRRDDNRPRHRRTLSNQSMSSSASSSEEEETQDHRAILAAARARLTSPSMVSSYTTQTNTTNKSSGSSGSNSTVTQASVTKRSLGKRPEVEDAPLSPAVPDPPNVFAFMDAPDEEDHEDRGDGRDGEDDDELEERDHGVARKALEWPGTNHHSAYVQSSVPKHLGSSSSGSSSHGDESSSPAVDNDTDRSTSPERSMKGQESEHEDRASVKIASQMQAAQQRQNLYESMQFGTPNMPRGPANYPVSAMSPRYPHPNQLPLPRAEKLPVTGYELLASRLSAPDEDGVRIKPMYRKFEALNHRLLLHLQDEISELEEQLHRLDHADTQSRRTERQIIPASRRAAAMAGGELQWHKTDILGRIGYKLAQYNQALNSFNTTQSLAPPDPDDISTYREYLQSEHPIAEVETHFLDTTDDLVSMYSEIPPHSTPSLSYSPSTTSISSFSRHQPPASPTSLVCPEQVEGLSGLALAVAVSVLVPILTFNVIPGFVGRITVTALVALGVIRALIQSNLLRQRMLFDKESLVCAGIYGGVMIILAGIMP